MVEFRLPQDEARKEDHEALGFDVLPYEKRWGNYRLRLTAEDFGDFAGCRGSGAGLIAAWAWGSWSRLGDCG